ncbi:hypothetical protein MNBD_ALPHA11-1444 [hydrothermal vent metagenome]|uniref:DUF1330 domain-containing protein n=1 Tax=hydrothermal vent metagenome TaxID=652676 RepID=A0A3B0TQM9_9ZZZZ
MTAIFVATMKIKDGKKMGEYGAGARATIKQYGGEMVFRANKREVLAGSSDVDAVVIAKFADMDALNAWHDSDEYQAIIPLRDEAVDMVLISYETPS